MIIDHIGFSVDNYQKSRDFFSRSLAPLGIELVVEIEGWAGFGREAKPEFWFGERDQKQSPMHIAFIAQNRAQVRAFHVAAMAAMPAAA